MIRLIKTFHILSLLMVCALINICCIELVAGQCPPPRCGGHGVLERNDRNILQKMIEYAMLNSE